MIPIKRSRGINPEVEIVIRTPSLHDQLRDIVSRGICAVVEEIYQINWAIWVSATHIRLEL